MQEKVGCPGGQTEPSELIAFARPQAGYILRANPNNISYMIGYGSRCPTHVHHIGASFVSMKNESAPVSCSQGYGLWLNGDAPDPNVLRGAIARAQTGKTGTQTQGRTISRRARNH
ncbi:endoglucanase 14-like [Eucalyptus grandis]|uniref:endoglucanase 14-like n=1 Tax=Eucalyptus grandis TaxID=71139 RepID=UPI00192E93B6|nr:endoglucanase 14-like [Eucalyptus grandis]